MCLGGEKYKNAISMEDFMSQAIAPGNPVCKETIPNKCKYLFGPPMIPLVETKTQP